MHSAYRMYQTLARQAVQEDNNSKDERDWKEVGIISISGEEGFG